MNKPFLILSHHRSWSNFMCNLLCENSKIECLNEPLSMHTFGFVFFLVGGIIILGLQALKGVFDKKENAEKIEKKETKQK